MTGYWLVRCPLVCRGVCGGRVSLGGLLPVIVSAVFLYFLQEYPLFGDAALIVFILHFHSLPASPPYVPVYASLEYFPAVQKLPMILFSPNPFPSFF